MSDTMICPKCGKVMTYESPRTSRYPFGHYTCTECKLVISKKP